MKQYRIALIAVPLIVLGSWMYFARQESGDAAALNAAKEMQSNDWSQLFERVDEPSRKANGWTKASFTSFMSTLNRGAEPWTFEAKPRIQTPIPQGSIGFHAFDPSNEAWLDVTFSQIETKGKITRTLKARRDPNGKWRADILHLAIERNKSTLGQKDRLIRLVEAMEAAKMSKIYLTAEKVYTTKERLQEAIQGRLTTDKIYVDY